jgi:hypothetical protein
MEQLKERLLDLFMGNPCLSQDIDYEPDNIRFNHYSEYVHDLSEDELHEQLANFGE